MAAKGTKGNDELVDLSNCEREPIQIPGSVQNFGALICFNKNGVVNRCSDNIKTLLGFEPEKIAGKTADTLFFSGDIPEVFREKTNGWEPVRVRLKSGIPVDVHLHKQRSEYFLDIIPVDDTRVLPDAVAVLRDFVNRASKLGSIGELAEMLASFIQELSGIDRVKVYQFDKDWNGEVIAEAKVPEMPSYLGLHFPHTDIPKQARELYQRNRVRVIADVDSVQAKLLDFDASEPLDMSFSFVRSVSEVHLQYLRNMEVGASMSISLFENGKFWGLLACHNRRPLRLTFFDAAIYESIADVCSTRLTGLAKIEQSERKVQAFEIVSKIVDRLTKKPLLRTLVQGRFSMKDLIHCNGTVAILNGEMSKFGAVPDNDALDRIVGWLQKGSNETVAYDDFPSRFTSDVRHYASGLLAAKIGNRPKSWLLWFRIETIREVTWAGDPFKPAEDTPFGPRLYPRSSFEQWKEMKEGQSMPWSALDIESASALAEWVDRLTEAGMLQQ